MKKSIALLSPLLMPFMLQAAELRIDCTGGRFFVDYIVAEGDSCSGERNININGQQFVEPLPVITNGNRTIPLEPTDTANITAEMACITPSGFTDTAFVAASTQNGCVGVTTTPAAPLPPQPAGFPNGVPDEDTPAPAEAAVIAQDTVIEEVTRQEPPTLDNAQLSTTTDNIATDVVIATDIPAGITLDASLLQQPNDVILATLEAVNEAERQACEIDSLSQACTNAREASAQVREILQNN